MSGAEFEIERVPGNHGHVGGGESDASPWRAAGPTAVGGTPLLPSGGPSVTAGVTPSGLRSRPDVVTGPGQTFFRQELQAGLIQSPEVHNRGRDGSEPPTSRSRSGPLGHVSGRGQSDDGDSPGGAFDLGPPQGPSAPDDDLPIPDDDGSYETKHLKLLISLVAVRVRPLGSEQRNVSDEDSDYEKAIAESIVATVDRHIANGGSSFGDEDRWKFIFTLARHTSVLPSMRWQAYNRVWTPNLKEFDAKPPLTLKEVLTRIENLDVEQISALLEEAKTESKAPGMPGVDRWSHIEQRAASQIVDWWLAQQDGGSSQGSHSEDELARIMEELPKEQGRFLDMALDDNPKLKRRV